jgi:hypothetical protein
MFINFWKELFMPTDTPIGRYRDKLSDWKARGWRIDSETVSPKSKKNSLRDSVSGLSQPSWMGARLRAADTQRYRCGTSNRRRQRVNCVQPETFSPAVAR